MGYSWVYLGDAEIPAAARAAWLAESTDPLPHAEIFNALDGFLVTEEEAAYDDDNVADALATLAECAEVQRVELGGPIVVRVLADKSGDAWLTYRWNLAAAFVLLARHGGRGRLDIVGFDDGPDEGIRIEVADGAVRTQVLDEDEVLALRQSEAYAELLELAEATFGDAEA